MKNYNKTIWQNNVTVVDQEKLNNVENQIQALTINSIQNNNRIQTIEDTLPMKANVIHEHEDMLDYISSLEDNLNNLKAELRNEFSKYFDNVELEENTLHFYSNNVLIKSIELPSIASNEVKAICGEVICGEVITNQGFNKNTKSNSYIPTVWEDGITPINANNLNNIENKIVELVQIVEEILASGGTVESNIHIGNTEPINKDVLWIDNTDEMPEANIEDSVLEALADVLREHSNKIDELYYLSDAYLDDGDFTDTEESDYILEGGIF